MTHATVFVILDAGRSDYVNPESMPFLSGLARSSVRGSFESPPGFAQRTALFSGRYPDTSGNFSQFVFDPENSPFAWTRRLGPVANVVKPRKLMFPARMAIKKTTSLLTGAYHADPAWIPPRFLPFFAPCEDLRPLYEPGALGAPSLFDLCRAHGRRFRYLAHPVSGDDEEVKRILLRELSDHAPYDLYVAQFSVTDEEGHRHGPHSDAMRKGFLRDVDGTLARIHATLTANYASWDLFVCGDHGMAPVHRRVDVLAALKAVDAKPGEDYVVFVNSTLAVFWYLTAKGRHAVEPVLETIPGARPIDNEERRRLRIPTATRWGHRMLAADVGTLFWPDYFHVQDSTIVGMHGYLDKSEETHGTLVLASSSRLGKEGTDIGLRPLVDVFPTLCDLLALPQPGGHEGRSILDRPRVVRAPPAAPTTTPTRTTVAAVPAPAVPRRTR